MGFDDSSLNHFQPILMRLIMRPNKTGFKFRVVIDEDNHLALSVLKAQISGGCQRRFFALNELEAVLIGVQKLPGFRLMLPGLVNHDNFKIVEILPKSALQTVDQQLFAVVGRNN